MLINSQTVQMFWDLLQVLEATPPHPPAVVTQHRQCSGWQLETWFNFFWFSSIQRFIPYHSCPWHQNRGGQWPWCTKTLMVWNSWRSNTLERPRPWSNKTKKPLQCKTPEVSDPEVPRTWEINSVEIQDHEATKCRRYEILQFLDHRAAKLWRSRTPGGPGPCSSEYLESSQNLCNDICANLQWNPKCITINIHTFIQLCPSTPLPNTQDPHTHLYIFHCNSLGRGFKHIGADKRRKGGAISLLSGPGRRQTVNKTKQFPGTKAEREQSIIGPGESGEVRLLGGGGGSGGGSKWAEKLLVCCRGCDSNLLQQEKKGKNWDRI